MKWFGFIVGSKLYRCLRNGTFTYDGLREAFEFPTTAHTGLFRSRWWGFPFLVIVEIIRTALALIQLDLVMGGILLVVVLVTSMGDSGGGRYWPSVRENAHGIWAFLFFVDIVGGAIVLPVRLLILTCFFITDPMPMPPTIKAATARTVPNGAPVRATAVESNGLPGETCADSRTYIFKDGVTEGPFNDEEIRLALNGGVAILDDWAWREGMADWVPLGTLYPQGAVPDSDQQNAALVGAEKHPAASICAGSEKPKSNAAQIIDPLAEALSDEQLVQKCIEIMRRERKANIPLFQRKLRLGYTRVARAMAILEERRFVGPGSASGPRKILVDLNSLS